MLRGGMLSAVAWARERSSGRPGEDLTATAEHVGPGDKHGVEGLVGPENARRAQTHARSHEVAVFEDGRTGKQENRLNFVGKAGERLRRSPQVQTVEPGCGPASHTVLAEGRSIGVAGGYVHKLGESAQQFVLPGRDIVLKGIFEAADYQRALGVAQGIHSDPRNRDGEDIGAHHNPGDQAADQ